MDDQIANREGSGSVNMPELSKIDRQLIEKAVKSAPIPGKNILSIECVDAGRVLVRMGRQDGPPRAGIGSVLEATKGDDGEWRVKEIGGWRS